MATGAYIGAGLGPGPRDGLMTGLAARGHSLRLVRTAIELSVLLAGWFEGPSLSRQRSWRAPREPTSDATIWLAECAHPAIIAGV